jgi:hypothetical protein
VTTKPCHRCKETEPIVGERYCSVCKAVVLAEIRRRSDEEMSVRDLSWEGTEWAGRPATDPRKCPHLADEPEELDEEGER